MDKTRWILAAAMVLGFGQVALAGSTESVYREAVTAFESQDWATAAERFKRAYHGDPTAAEAEDSLFFWGESLLQSDEFDGAKQRFDEYLRQWPQGQRVRAARFRMAEALMLAKRYPEAKHQIERFMAIYPKDSLFEYTTAYLAEIAVAENHVSEAERLFKDVIQNYPQSPLVAESHLGLARLQEQQGKLKESLALLEPILEKRDTASRPYREAVVLRSSLLSKLGKAKPDIVPSSATEPPSSSGRDADGSASLLPVTDSESLMPIEEKTLPPVEEKTVAPIEEKASLPSDEKASGVTVDALWHRAQFFERSGKFDPALAVYEDLYRQFPRGSEADEARLAAARIHARLHQYCQARSLYDELILRLGKREAGATLDFATVLFEAALVEEQLEGNNGHREGCRSVDLLKRLCQNFPKHPDAARAAYRLARYAVDAENFETARRYLKTSLASDDVSLVGHSFELSWRIAAAERDWAAARVAAERFLALDEKRVPATLCLMARFWIAESDYRTGRYQSARHRFEALAGRLQGQESKESASWSGLVALRSAQSLAQLGDFSAARRAAEKGAAAFPTFVDRYEFDYLIGHCALVQGEYLAAHIAFDRVARSPVAEQSGTSLLAREAIASTFFAQKDYETAAAEFTKLQSADVPASHRAKSLHYTALCYERLGKKRQAETLYQRLVDRYPEYRLR